MNGFCVETITIEARLRARHGILPAQALTISSDARALAARMVQQARTEAEGVLHHARGEAKEAIRQAEEQAVQRAARLVQSLELANAAFLERAQDVIIDLAQTLFERLVMNATPREQIEAALRRILQEAPPRLVDPMLRVHPDDFELLPAVDWEIKADAALARGSCRLEATNGEWYADFTAGVDAVQSAFARAREETGSRGEEGRPHEP